MHNIIKTPNYLLIVDDSKIELGSWHTCTYPEYPLEARFTDESTKYDICKGCKNIVAHLPLNNAPTLEGVDLLPLLEDDVDLMYENTEDLFYKKYDDALHYYSFIEGYNKAKEKYKYTEEDIMSAMKYAVKYYSHMWDDSDGEKIIQSFQQPKMPIGFNLEAKDTHIQNGVLVKSQWVGKYIY
jgi:hypothetical protein